MRRSGIKRRTALQLKSAGLVRRTPLAQVSQKRARENRKRAKVIRQANPDGAPVCAVPWCDRIGDSPHEPMTRARGGSITNPDNIVMVCWPHNQELTLEPEWGYSLGLLKHSWER